jgi:hypothetical protein
MVGHAGEALACARAVRVVGLGLQACAGVSGPSPQERCTAPPASMRYSMAR